MKLLLHHVRKDLRHSRWLIAITWLVAAVILWLPAMSLEERINSFEWLPFVRYGSWALLFLTIGRIVQLDAPLRDTAFLRSRPVSSNEWLASKLASGLIVMFPMALLHVAMILLAGMQPEFIDLLLIFLEEMLVLGVVAAFAMVIATRSMTYSNFIAAAMGMVFATLIIIAVYVNAAEWFTRETKPVWSYDAEYLKLSRRLITQTIAALGLLGGWLLCVRAGRPERLSAAIAGTVLVAALAWLFWPVNFVKTFTRPEAAAPLSEWPDLSKIEFAFEERRVGPDQKSGFTWGFGGYNSGYYQHVRAYTRMEGLDPGWFAHAYPNGYRSALRSSAGIVADSLQVHTSGIAVEVILPALGILPPWKPVQGTTEVHVGEFPVTAVEAAGTNATLEGEVHIPLKRPVVLARIPLKAGVSTRIGNRRLAITSVEITKPDRISYQIIDERSMSQLRGGWYGEPHRDIKMIAIHAGRGEFLEMQSRGSSGHAIGRYSLRRLDHIETIWRDPWKQSQDRTIPPGWLDGAELIITGDEYGGTFTHEFHFENVNLIDKSWRP